jgi:hypothetical protein
MNWHADRDTLDSYADGRITEAGAFSLEAHLLVCAQCRAALAGAVGRGRLDRIWAEVIDQVDRPRSRFFEPLLARLGVPGHIARLLVTMPVVRPSWYVTVAAVLGSIVLAARGTGGGDLLFLLVAPVVPVVGIAFASAPRPVPIDEVGLASPTGGFRLLLIRTTGILLASIALSAVAALALPRMGWTAAAWLLPSFTLTVLTLALSTKVAPHGAAATVTIAWAVAVTLAERLATGPYAAFGLDAQILLGAIASASVLMLIVRRGAFETRSLA